MANVTDGSLRADTVDDGNLSTELVDTRTSRCSEHRDRPLDTSSAALP